MVSTNYSQKINLLCFFLSVNIRAASHRLHWHHCGGGECAAAARRDLEAEGVGEPFSFERRRSRLLYIGEWRLRNSMTQQNPIIINNYERLCIQWTKQQPIIKKQQHPSLPYYEVGNSCPFCFAKTRTSRVDRLFFCLCVCCVPVAFQFLFVPFFVQHEVRSGVHFFIYFGSVAAKVSRSTFLMKWTCWSSGFCGMVGVPGRLNLHSWKPRWLFSWEFETIFF